MQTHSNEPGTRSQAHELSRVLACVAEPWVGWSMRRAPIMSPTPLASLNREKNEAIDEKGRRTIVHTASGAKLSSIADQTGRLLRQELVFNEEITIWQHGTRIRTGLLPAGSHDATEAKFDQSPSRLRLDRARMAIGTYTGDDKYIQHLSRVLALSAGLSLAGAEVVTRTAQDLRSARKGARGTSPKAYALIGLLGVVVFVLVYLAAR